MRNFQRSAASGRRRGGLGSQIVRNQARIGRVYRRKVVQRDRHRPEAIDVVVSRTCLGIPARVQVPLFPIRPFATRRQRKLALALGSVLYCGHDRKDNRAVSGRSRKRAYRIYSVQLEQSKLDSPPAANWVPPLSTHGGETTLDLYGNGRCHRPSGGKRKRTGSGEYQLSEHTVEHIRTTHWSPERHAIRVGRPGR